VGVPVRNEAAGLVATLDALRRQTAPDGRPLPPDSYEVLVLVNNSTDDSYALARGYQDAHPAFRLWVEQAWFPPALAHIGTVRRHLMDAACARLAQVGRPRGVIASTDGDTLVDPHWLFHILREIRAGVDAVSGRILTRPDASAVRPYHLRDVAYRQLVAQLEVQLDPAPHNPWPRHFQHFGASFALTGAAYLRAGRLPVVPFLEDEALYRALLRVDARVRNSPLVRVYTSARQQGRVEVGFSEQLRCWATMQRAGQVPHVEPAGAWVVRFRNRHRLRRCWQTLDTSDYWADAAWIAHELGLDANWLGTELPRHACFGTLWEEVETRLRTGAWAQRWPPVPITRAITELRHLLRG
jgi:glycosyltransferase involved in cell wall biosynthesis